MHPKLTWMLCRRHPIVLWCAGLVAAVLAGAAGMACVLSALAGAWRPVALWLVAVAGLTALAVALRRVTRPRAAPAQLPAPASPTAAPQAADPTDMASLVAEMLAQGRYALLLRRQVVANLAPEQAAQAWDLLQQQMSLVPEGEVSLAEPPGFADEEDAEEQPDESNLIRVGALFLDRFAVTNAQYQHFVDAGGYQQMAIWDPHIWPAVLDFVDSTGRPGPRFWVNGRYLPGQEHLPVVGVSWYEAAAYARWVGKRLPSEAEWVKAGAWPVRVGQGRCVQRRYPWGDTMDRERCNLWGSGPGRLVPVDHYPEGVSVGGAYQLIGNVWEWTTGNFGYLVGTQELALPTPMKSIRGGAFDTYFENQATCQFQSGENPLARKHNIGFRCAISLCDVSLPDTAAGAAVDARGAEPDAAEAACAHATAAASPPTDPTAVHGTRRNVPAPDAPASGQPLEVQA
jgi:iron(II)-dependent oxidoreductase